MGIEQNPSKTNKRRSFIKKASAGVVVTSLPMKSVWGQQCTASGAMSGNLSNNGDQVGTPCQAPYLVGGRSPGFWFEGNQMELSEYKNGKWHDDNAVGSAFTHLPEVIGNTRENRDCYRKHVHTAYNIDMELNKDMVEAVTGVRRSYTVGEGFASKSSHSNIFRDLANVYLNIYFGFYVNAGYEDKDDASAAVNQLLASYIAGGQTSWFSEEELGWKESTNTPKGTSAIPLTCPV